MNKDMFEADINVITIIMRFMFQMSVIFLFTNDES